MKHEPKQPINERRITMLMRNRYTGEEKELDNKMDVRIWTPTEDPIQQVMSKRLEAKLSIQKFQAFVEVREAAFDVALVLWNSVQTAMGRPLSTRIARIW